MVARSENRETAMAGPQWPGRLKYLCWARVLLVGLSAEAVLAQTTMGGVKGTVRDATSGVVPNCAITLLNTETTVARQMASNAEGLYNFPDVPPGKYQLTVENQGFKKWAVTFELQVQQLAVLDAALEVGDLSATIEVADATPVIARESTSIGTVTDFRRIQQLPLDGRDINTLLQLTPGVEGIAAPRVNGLKAGSVEFLQDGGSIIDRFGGGTPRVRPGLDSIQEFRVDTNSSAQFSRPTTVSIVTRSGTNELHGSMFETHRNNGGGLRARRREEREPSPLIRNEFGATGGGPASLPGLYDGRGKTFWFASYEGERRRAGVVRSFYVPTEAMWNGDFSRLVDAQGNLWKIYDPLTTDASGVRQQFPGNVIPPSYPRSKLFEFLKAHTPRSNRSVGPLVDVNWVGPFPEVLDKNTFASKIDHRFSDKDGLSGRLTISNTDGYGYICCDVGPPAPDLSFNFTRQRVHLSSAAITHTHVFSPTLLNELVVSGQRSAKVAGGGREDVRWTEQLGLPNPFGEAGWPSLEAYGEGNAYFVWDSQNKKPEFLNTIILQDNLTWVKGKHEWKFGFVWRDERNNIKEAQQGQGAYSFDNGWTGLYDPASGLPVNFTGSGLASLLLGYGSEYSVQYNRGFFYFRQREYGAYAQDTWKLTPRLTLNYGLRYDLWTPYREARNRLVAFDLGNFRTSRQVITPTGAPMESLGVPPSLLASYAAAGLTWTTADKVGFPDQLLKTGHTDFAPRAGAVFQLNDKTVVRGAYGVYYWTMPLSQILQTARQNAPLNLRYALPISTLDGEDYFAFRSQPAPELNVSQLTALDVNTPQPVPTPLSFAPWATDWHDGRAQVWNFTVEREVAPRTSLRLSYVGSHGDHLEQRVNVNTPESQYLYALRTGEAPPSTNLRRPNPFWNDLPATNHTGFSNSHSLHVDVQRRYGHGLAFQWFYVFSRNRSTSDGEGFTAEPGQAVPARQTVLNAGSYDDLLKLVSYNVASVPRHRIGWNGLVDLPFGRGKWIGRNASGPLDQIIGGWQLAAIGSFRTGNWLSIGPGWFLDGNPTLSGDERKTFLLDGRPVLLFFRGAFNATGIAGLENYRPALVRLGPNHDNRVQVTLKDGSTRLIPYDVYNTTPRNFIEGPRAWTVDLSLFKNFRFTKGANLRFTADFFNAFNHPNDVDPNPVTGLIDLSRQANEPRTIQLSLRLEF